MGDASFELDGYRWVGPAATCEQCAKTLPAFEVVPWRDPSAPDTKPRRSLCRDCLGQQRPIRHIHDVWHTALCGKPLRCRGVEMAPFSFSREQHARLVVLSDESPVDVPDALAIRFLEDTCPECRLMLLVSEP